MLDLAKTLALYASADKWLLFEESGRHFFTGLNPQFDRLTDVIRNFYERHRLVLSPSALTHELKAANDRELLSYVQTLGQNTQIPAYRTIEDFATALDRNRQSQRLALIEQSYALFRGTLGTQAGLYPDKVDAAVRDLQSGIAQTEQRVRQAESASALRMYGDEAVTRMRERYQGIMTRKEEGVASYYNLGFSFFKNVNVYPGDLITILGFTSHCKSALAREICYNMLLKDTLNVAFWSTEMDAADVELLFAIRHANNKAIFPGTVKIPFSAFKHGDMNAEQEDLYFHAWADFCQNPKYGVLSVERPTSIQFNLEDLSDRCSSIEAFMPIHVCAVDYLQQMNPLMHGGRASGDSRADINRMIANFRLFCLSYRRRDGKSAPLVGMTPAQISRGKLDEAMKNDRKYDSSAASDYNEVERSSAIMLSTLMPPDLRATNRALLQCLKNRLGEVPEEAFETHVALAHGMGYQELDEPDPEDFVDRLAELSTMDFSALSPI